MKRRTFRRFSIIRRILGLEAAPSVRRPAVRMTVVPSRRSTDSAAILGAAPLDANGHLLKGSETDFVSGRLQQFPTLRDAVKASVVKLW